MIKRLPGIVIVLLLTWMSGLGCHRQPAGPSPEMIARHNRAVALMGQFDYAAAYDELKALLESNPNWLDVKVDWAIATLNRRQDQDAEQAVKALREVLAASPSNLRATYCLGILSLDRGEPEEARQYFTKVTTADPRDAYALYYVGQCEFQLGKVAESLEHYVAALSIDPYLRSCYYGAFQAALRLDQAERAEQYRQDFERLSDNPQSRLAEIKYTRMGPKAELQPLNGEAAPVVVTPTGPLFQSPFVAPLGADNAKLPWRNPASLDATLTAGRLGDAGGYLIVVTQALASEDAPNLVVDYRDGVFNRLVDHPFARVTKTTAVCWGDYDNDGLTDVYFSRRGPNELWRQVAPNRWENVTEATKTSGGDLTTRDCQMLDADHDGDLDLLLLNEGPNELLSNNLDGTFRALAADFALTGNGRASLTAAAGDLDRDRDLDLFVVHDQPPHELFLNDRLWRYRNTDLAGPLLSTPIESCAAFDRNADGQLEMMTLAQGKLTRWERDVRGDWAEQTLSTESPLRRQPPARMAMADLDGDGRSELCVDTEAGWAVIDVETGKVKVQLPQPYNSWALLPTPGSQGPGLLALGPLGLEWWQPGTGRFEFAQANFTGKDVRADQMRSNRSGLGVDAAVRRGTQWTAVRTLRNDSGPGQSLLPTAIGLAGQKQLDFVQVNWPDGILQTETELPAGKLSQITETQRQLSSCPVVFAWNGQNYEFVTDVLGGGGLGFNLADGQYGEPRPDEHLLLNRQQLVTSDGLYRLQVTEPMEEVCYLDSVRLTEHVMPAPWQMTLDERFAINGAPPTGEPLYYRQLVLPRAAVNSQGQSVLDRLATVDGRAVEPGEKDVRFIGRTQPHTVEMEFDVELNHGRPVLLIDGWIEYPYSQTMFAAWQANAHFLAPSLQAQDQDGNWHVVAEQFGYMAGMPRQAALPLDAESLPLGCQRLRLSSNLEIYWDRVAIAFAEPPPPAYRRQELLLASARVVDSGFARRVTLAQHRPYYDAGRGQPLWDTRHPRGWYTQFGEARPLLERTDDAVAIFGPGEGVELAFKAAEDAPDMSGQSVHRYFELHFAGWCKDRDLYTRDAETVEPLPRRSAADSAANEQRERLHEQYNHRYGSGY